MLLAEGQEDGFLDKENLKFRMMIAINCASGHARIKLQCSNLGK